MTQRSFTGRRSGDIFQVWEKHLLLLLPFLILRLVYGEKNQAFS